MDQLISWRVIDSIAGFAAFDEAMLARESLAGSWPARRFGLAPVMAILAALALKALAMPSWSQVGA